MLLDKTYRTNLFNNGDVNNSSKDQLYRIFKQSFGFENYLKILSPKYMKILINFRTINHRLPVETGLKIKSSDQRYYNSPTPLGRRQVCG